MRHQPEAVQRSKRVRPNPSPEELSRQGDTKHRRERTSSPGPRVMQKRATTQPDQTPVSGPLSKKPKTEDNWIWYEETWDRTVTERMLGAVVVPGELKRTTDRGLPGWETPPPAYDNWARNDGSLWDEGTICLLYTSPSPRDQRGSRMPSSA